MYQTLLTMEKNFFKFQFISDKNWLNSVLHTDFKECGQSGKLSDKITTIDGLLSCSGDRDIEIYNFDCTPLGHGCWMVHYITKSSENMLFYRTSIWVNEEHLKLIFHQATPFYENVNLNLC